MKRCIQIFAKAPIQGQVKTRMQPELNATQSVRLAEKLLYHSCRIATEYSHAEVQLWGSPGIEHSYFKKLSNEFPLTLFAQKGGHLGQRMINAMNHALNSSLYPLLIGADCPFITNQYLDSAFEQLEQYDAVLGPATDGGYVLIGSKQLLPKGGFDGIDWGTPNVLQHTVRKFNERGLSYSMLAALADIDRYQDLELLEGIIQW